MAQAHIQQQHAGQEDGTAGRQMAALAAFANARLPALAGFSFRALPPDTSLQDAPTYAVQMRNADGQLAATYKFNYFADETGWQFFPLVIQWAEDAKFRAAGMDSAIIEHCLLSLRQFFVQDCGGARLRLTMASGYLTTQRHGRAFFERIGWIIHSFDKQENLYPALLQHPAPFQSMAQRIDDISMPFRTDAAEAATLCFAVIEL
jgi:hypothetical protein